MILITGATGLVGANLCYTLTQSKQSIVALYRRESKRDATRDFFEKKGDQNGALFNSIIWRKADLNNHAEMTDAFKGITHVYHCAAYISMAQFKLEQLTRVNQQGTADLVNLCIENKIQKLAYVSSIAALGADTLENRIDEETPWNPTKEKTGYSYSKYGAELEVWRASQEGVPIVIVNPGVILGVGMPRNPLDQLIDRIKKGLVFYPTGKTGYVAVEDVVQVLINLMNSSIENERFILVSENWTYKKILNYMAKALNKKEAKRPLRPSYLYSFWIIESILSALGLRKKFLSRALINSLCDSNEIDGKKITTKLDFKYRPIQKYLESLGY